MKKILFLMLLSIPLLFASCEKQVATQEAEVAFTVNDNGPALSKKDSGEQIPVLECIDGEATSVEVVIDGTSYMLEVLNLEGNTITQSLKLPTGDHIISSFVVFNEDGEIMWVTPMAGSDYAVMWPDLSNLDLTFTVEDFTKAVVPIDVLCFREADIVAFGYSWFQFHAFESKPLCFFGDICSKFYEDFNDAKGPYNGQVAGHDFIALFTVEVFGPDGELMSSATNVGVEDLNQPVCLEYLDDLEVADEEYTFLISIIGPQGYVFATTGGSFTDAEWSGDGSDPKFGGDDGVWEFVVGNCIAENTDAVVLPAYLALPSNGNVTMKAVKHNGATHYEYFDILLNSGFNGAYYPDELFNGALLGGYCGDLYNNIPVDGTYDVNVFSSLGAMPAQYASYPWGSLNWLANQDHAITESHTEGKLLQAIVWFMIHDGTAGLFNEVKGHLGLTTAEATSAQAVAQYALANESGFEPLTGDFCLVLFDPIEGSGPSVDTEFVQLMLVRVDP